MDNFSTPELYGKITLKFENIDEDSIIKLISDALDPKKPKTSMDLKDFLNSCDLTLIDLDWNN